MPRTLGAIAIRALVILAFAASLMGTSNFSCGGGPTVRIRASPYVEGVDQSCDTAPGGMPRPGCDVDDWSLYECPAPDPDSAFCGICTETSLCAYCETVYTCPADPCGDSCGRPRDAGSCPSDAPVGCGNGYCCPRSHPICCPGGGWCGTSSAACAMPSEDTGGGAFDCSPGNPQVSCTAACSGRACSVSSCGGPSGSGCSFYRASDGTLFRPSCSTGDCLTNAANAALRYCGCI